MASILCVDDSEAGLVVRQLVLESRGHTVVTATSGAKALALTRLAVFDVVITDFLLGDCTGAELAQALKVERPETAVVLLTGLMEAEQYSHLVDKFVVKGEHPTLLLAAVDELVGLNEVITMSRAAGF